MSRTCAAESRRAPKSKSAPHSAGSRPSNAKSGMFIAPAPVTCGRSSEMGHVISELTGPFWAACREGGSISELKGDFSLFASEMSSETATLKALSWISELTSEDLSLKSALSLYSVGDRPPAERCSCG